MYRNLENIILQDSYRNITFQGNQFFTTQKVITCEFEYDLFCLQAFTKSLSLDIRNKMYVVETFHLLLRTLNMNEDDNEETFYGILTNSIRTLTDLYFMIIGEKSSTNIPLNNKYSLKIVQKWRIYLDPCTFS